MRTYVGNGDIKKAVIYVFAFLLFALANKLSFDDFFAVFYSLLNHYSMNLRLMYFHTFYQTILESKNVFNDVVICYFSLKIFYYLMD